MIMSERSVFRRIFGGSGAPTAEPPAAAAAAEAPAPKRASWLQRLKSGLARSSSAMSEGIAAVLTKRRIDAEALDDFEDFLLKTDLGLETAAAITEKLRAGRFHADITVGEAKEIVAAEIDKVLEPVAKPLVIDPALKPHVILVVGVNGTGKTTTIGKLAAKLRDEGKSVVLAAGDTFRAAAIDQLKIWGERAGVLVVARRTRSGRRRPGLRCHRRKPGEAVPTSSSSTPPAGCRTRTS